jgi:hypothetical protein
MSTYRGKVENGKVVFDGLVSPLPNGTPVDITPRGLPTQSPDDRANGKGGVDPIYRIGDDAVDTGVADGSIEHDHYIYGSPKRSHKGNT